MPHPFLAVVGGGNMGKAIVVGGVNAGTLSPARVCVADPAAEKRARFGALGVHVVGTASEALAWLQASALRADDGQLLLAIKPQSLAKCAAELTPGASEALHERVVMTILAGATSERVRDAMGGRVRVVRAMPNLPAAIGKGVTAMCLGAGAQAGDDLFARRVFSAVGSHVVSLDESMMDAFTAVAGSGPAYVFYLAEAMVDGAMRVGFSREQATAIVRGTLAGSGLLLEQSPDEPARLREAVTSKGGTTQAATTMLDARGVKEDFVLAIEAARDRGREIAEQA